MASPWLQVLTFWINGSQAVVNSCMILEDESLLGKFAADDSKGTTGMKDHPFG